MFEKRDISYLVLSLAIISLILSFLLIFKPALTGYATSKLGINNTAPQLLQPIPNQTILYNSLTANVFDLDDYFYDVNYPDGSDLSFITIGASQITFSIGALSHLVNMTAINNFTGSQYAVFRASDSLGGITDSNNVTIFVVTNITTTSTTSTTSVAPTPQPPSGGGGGRGGSKQPKPQIQTPGKVPTGLLEVDKKLIEAELTQGTDKNYLLKIKNIGKKDLTLLLQVAGLEQYIKPSENTFELKVGKSKSLTLYANVPKNMTIGVYTAKLYIYDAITDELLATVDLILTIKPIITDFTIDVVVDENHKVTYRNGKVIADISVKNLGTQLDSEISLYYALRDLDGNIIASSEENTIIKDAISLKKTFAIPKDATLGTYIFIARLNKDDYTTIGSDTFEIKKRFEALVSIIYVNLALIIIFVIVIIIVLFYLRYKNTKRKERLLHLYFLISEANKFVQEGKIKDASDNYVKIKLLYNEDIPPEVLKDEEKIKKDIIALYDRVIIGSQNIGNQKQVEDEAPSIEKGLNDMVEKVPVNPAEQVQSAQPPQKAQQQTETKTKHSKKHKKAKKSHHKKSKKKKR